MAAALDRRPPFAAVLAVLSRADPEGLLRIGAPPDEYAPEAAELAGRLREGRPVDAEVLIAVWERWFGPGSGYARRASTSQVAGLAAEVAASGSPLRSITEPAGPSEPAEVVAALNHVSALAAGPPLDPSLRVNVHFHPDRPVDGRPLLEHLAVDGVYRSQFETLTSNGGLTAHPGGDRWVWEHRMFGGAYDRSPAGSRPKYGSLNHRRRPAGGSPRFGSAHLRLSAHTLARTTFCYPDSVEQPTSFGTVDHMGLAPMADADRRDLLDDYIEAHVHGSLDLEHDVEAIVLDPAYRDTPIEAMAAALPFPVEWHHGFRLSTTELGRHPTYRGPDVIAAGRSIAEQGWLDARIIGAAASTGEHDDHTLKRVWHYTARFGRPSQRSSRSSRSTP